MKNIYKVIGIAIIAVAIVFSSACSDDPGGDDTKKQEENPQNQVNTIEDPDPIDPNLPTTATLWHRGGIYAGNGSFTGMSGSEFNEVVIVFDRQFSAVDVVVTIESTNNSVNFYLRNTFIGSTVGGGINWTSGNEYGSVASAEGRTKDQYDGGIVLNPLAKLANCIVIHSSTPLELTIRSITIGGNTIEIDFSTATSISEFVNELGEGEEPPPPPVCSCAGCDIETCGCELDCEHDDCWKCPVCDPPQYITVEVLGREQQVLLESLGGNLTVTNEGYHVEYVNGHGNHWVGFKIDFGIFSVSSIANVEFDIKTIALEEAFEGEGKITIRAMSNPQLGWMSDSFVLETVVSEWGSRIVYDYESQEEIIAPNINASGVANPAVTVIDNGYITLEYPPQFHTVSIDIDPTTPNSSLTGEVWFSIYMHAGPLTEIEVKNIKLIAAR